MKSFLILQLRSLDAAADSEFQAFLKYGQLNETQVLRIRMEKESFAGITASDYAGIIVGGGPSNISDEESSKPGWQRRFEAELDLLYEQIVEEDIPYLGNCYGLGSLVRFLGSEVSKERYSEEVGYTTITLSKEANDEVLLSGLPKKFKAFVGHKEACQEVPEGSVLLGSSSTCPVQMIRHKKNIYATQFHTELDAAGIAERVDFYKNHGYFEPEAANEIISRTKDIVTREAALILHRFVQRYRS